MISGRDGSDERFFCNGGRRLSSACARRPPLRPGPGRRGELGRRIECTSLRLCLPARHPTSWLPMYAGVKQFGLAAALTAGAEAYASGGRTAWYRSTDIGWFAGLPAGDLATRCNAPDASDAPTAAALTRNSDYLRRAPKPEFGFSALVTRKSLLALQLWAGLIAPQSANW